MRKNLMIAAALVFLISACLPGQNDAEVESRVQTAVAQTMQVNEQVARIVENTMTALIPAASPTLSITDTPMPTATLEPVIIDTDTPFPLPVFPSDTPAPVSVKTQPPYSCYIATLKPKSGQEMGPGDSFDIVMIVVNTGTATWRSGVDVKHAGGSKLTGPSRVQIGVAMAPGDQFKFSLTGKAPVDKGLYYMSWMVEGPTCYGQVSIVVK